VSTPELEAARPASRRARWFALALLIIVLDQLSKWLALDTLTLGRPIEVTGFFNLSLAFNRGAAFSFLAGADGWQAALFALLAVVAAGVISVLIWRHPAKRLFCSGLTLILGGALGNLVDRLRLGQVVDFLDFHALGSHWPTFNIADSAITVGAALLIIDGFREQRSNA
jgi:signal peptidase II